MKETIIILLLLFTTACYPSSTLEGPFNATRAIDGDTLELSTKEKVRLSGIDTPEKDECYYKEAKQRLSELVAGKQVYLERDYTNKDKYHRLLRYVYVGNNEVNVILVEKGYARVYDKYAYDTKKYKRLKDIETLAVREGRGIWSCLNESNI